MEGTLPPLAVVTGAGVRLGRAIAQEFCRQGYAIGLHYYHSEQEAQSLAVDLERKGGKVLLLPANLTDPEQIDTMFTTIDSSRFPLKVLVNSAAIMPHARLSNTSLEAWDEVLSLNLRAPWLCSLKAAERMLEGGAIVNISDVGARKTWTGYGAYVISKSALETLTRLLARELAPQVRVNAVAPGLILPAPEVSPEDWQRLINRLPLKRSGTPEDIARTVTFLINNHYITGEVLAADGGYLLQ